MIAVIATSLQGRHQAKQLLFCEAAVRACHSVRACLQLAIALLLAIGMCSQKGLLGVYGGGFAQQAWGSVAMRTRQKIGRVRFVWHT